MPGTSGFKPKIFLILPLLLALALPSARAENAGELAAAADNILEASQQDDIPNILHKKRKKRKVRKKKTWRKEQGREERQRELSEARQKFAYEERKRKREFVDSIRYKNMSDEDRHKKIEKFYAGELERRQEFSEKQKKKIREG